jgi:hypothetical protein
MKMEDYEASLVCHHIYNKLEDPHMEAFTLAVSLLQHRISAPTVWAMMLTLGYHQVKFLSLPVKFPLPDTASRHTVIDSQAQNLQSFDLLSHECICLTR